jgi:hypothetical protein
MRRRIAYSFVRIQPLSAPPVDTLAVACPVMTGPSLAARLTADPVSVESERFTLFSNSQSAGNRRGSDPATTERSHVWSRRHLRRTE